ncbi:HAMP domain-containing sensor histidine kinase [Kribbella sp. NPDC003505]|uniref:GAF domain-containing sensor histidine kinase n=1 Tax=Kribbella sp. NPDC003505 TaxID=3154448 RepID=UPI0033B21B74
MEIFGQSTRASSVILWEAARNNVANPAPSVVAVWPRDGTSMVRMPNRADPTTLSAFSHRTLAISPAGEPGGDASPNSTVAALPIDFLDGSVGVLTLCGSGERLTDSFDVAADLLEVLPELLSVVRDRKTLDLVNVCDALLREAEFESSRQPLNRELLVSYLTKVCHAIGASLKCADVSIYLREGGDAPDSLTLVATSSAHRNQDPGSWRPTGLVGKSVERGTPDVATSTGDFGLSPGSSLPPGELDSNRTLMVAPLTTGEDIWGAISCSLTYGLPSHFTQADVSLLVPISSQIAQHWSNWLQRRTIALEIDSWRRLAAAITTLNKLVADELRREQPHDDRVDAMATSIVQDVVQDCVGARVLRTTASGGSRSRLAVAFHTPTPVDHERLLAGAPPYETPLADVVHMSKSQRIATDAETLSSEGLTAAAHWLIGTPISVGEKFFGVLEAFGPSRDVPANSPQVCEIVGDQLGLYQHLQQSLQRLREARHRLEVTNRGQAQALEDLEHQLVSPLLAATSRTDRVLQVGRFDSRTEAQLRAVRGLCRRASRVALSAGVFAALSKGTHPRPKMETHSGDDLLRLLIAAADDAQMLSNPRRRIRFDVARESITALGRRVVNIDRAFFEQCIGNILDNAAKYSYEDTRVNIYGAVAPNSFTIHVVNTGIPLQDEEAVLCLQRNWRGTLARASTGEGSGIGLWIVDNLMRSMQARIDLAPTGDGTTVRLVFPLTY